MITLIINLWKIIYEPNTHKLFYKLLLIIFNENEKYLFVYCIYNFIKLIYIFVYNLKII